jgi:dihydrofolate synthase/folylpolyglutamate synthase
MVVLDGAHSEIKMQSTAENLRKLRFGKLRLIFALAHNKDTKEVAEVIAQKADIIYATRFNNPFRKSTDPKSLAATCKKFVKRGAKIEIFYDPWQALKTALKTAEKNDLILATGSFFLAGDLRKHWYPEDWVLKRRMSKN